MTDGAAPRCVPQAALADLADVPAVSRWVRSDGVRLHVLDYGGDGVPLVVLPGITSPAIAMIRPTLWNMPSATRKTFSPSEPLQGSCEQVPRSASVSHGPTIGMYI